MPLCFYRLLCTPPLQHWKQELSRDNATLRDTLQAASDTLARVSELLHGMDRAKEVSTAPPGLCPRRGWTSLHAECDPWGPRSG